MIGTVLGHHRILDLLGSGAMGEVYLAEDLRLRRRVALKLLPRRLAEDPGRLARFRREAMAIASFSHPHAVTIYSIDEATVGEQTVAFLTMEWVDGVTLDKAVGETGLAPERFVGLARQLLGALGAAHASGVVHRDLKPGNIMVDRDGRAKILDFGLAKLRAADGSQAGDDAGALSVGDGADVALMDTALLEPVRDGEAPAGLLATLTEVGAVMGTIPYMSPEQLRGEAVDLRSDLFSLGTVLYEAATGRRPFPGGSSAEIMSAILRDSPPPLASLRPDLPPAVAEVVMRCLEKVARERPESCEAVAAALDAGSGPRSAGGDGRVRDLYQRGRQFFYRKNRQGFELARRLFDRVIEIDPGYARAYAGIADSCSFLFQWWGRDPTHRAEALEASAKAIELAPDVAECRASRGLALSIAGEPEAAERELQRALELGPDQFETVYLYARIQFGRGDFAAAARYFQRASEIDPDDYQSLVLLAQTFEALGDKASSLDANRRGLARADARLEFHPDDARALYLAASAVAVLGDAEKARDYCERALAVAPDDPFVLWNVACASFLSGRLDEGLAFLERAADLGFGHREWIQLDPSCEPVRRHPRFLHLLERMAKRESGVAEPAPSSSIAVLPFSDLSEAGDQGYFCRGLADELIQALARVASLRVASRTSSFQFEGSALDVREIGRRLGVRHVLEGSVRRAGDELRVSAHVNDVAHGFTVWSESYDRRIESVFAIQREIAEQTVSALRGVITDAERAALVPTATRDHAAYDCYIQGRQLYYDGGAPATAAAVRLFRRAIELDPGYAVAWAGLADAASFSALYFAAGSEGRRQALEASARAVELAPGLAEAHAARGLALSLVPDYPAAVRELERALEIQPGLFDALYLSGRVAFAERRYADAEALYRRAAEARPEAFQVFNLLAKALHGRGREAEAREAQERALALADHRLELRSTDPRALAARACALVELGRVEEGLEAARHARETPSCDALFYYIACAYARAGALEPALETLEAAVAAGWSHADWLAADPDLDPLRDQPRFQQLAAAIAAQASR